VTIFLIYSVLITFFFNTTVGYLNIVRGLSVFNIILFLLLTVWIFQKNKSRRIFQPTGVIICLVVLGFIGTASIPVKILHYDVRHVNVLSEILLLKQWFSPMLLFLLLFSIIDSKKICYQALIGVCFLLVALILNQFASLFGLTGYHEAYISRFGRVGGFGAPGVYAITLSLFMPFIFAGVLFYRKSDLVRGSCIVLAFLSFMGLVAAGSRNGALSFLVGMGAYLLILKHEKVMRILPIISAVLLIISVGTVSFIFSPASVKKITVERFEPDTSGEFDANKYSHNRLAIYTDILEKVAQRPILGHGFGTFPSAHNEYLFYLGQFGIVGLFVYLLTYWMILRYIWQAQKRTTSKWQKQLYISYIAGLLSYMSGIGFTVAGPSLMIFWIYTALILKHAQLDISQEIISSRLQKSSG